MLTEPFIIWVNNLLSILITILVCCFGVTVPPGVIEHAKLSASCPITGDGCHVRYFHIHLFLFTVSKLWGLIFPEL